MRKTRLILCAIFLTLVGLPLYAGSFRFGADQTHVSKSSKELKGNAFYDSKDVYISADLIFLPESGPITLSGKVELKSKKQNIVVETNKAHYYKDAQVLIVPAWGRIIDSKEHMAVQAGYMSIDLSKKEIELSIDARIWQEKQNVIGRADKIDVKEDKISFFGDAELKQEDNSYKAQSIVFDRKTEKVILFGDVAGEMTSQDKTPEQKD